ncbi:glycoside hydrolase family 3 protein [Nocardioides sp. SYSU D00065]|uniref:beta-glucosidase n=1 Tax=Nocardioides sp. SYSU D00065 TaxID=2817378 RepID=UPI001B3229CA|nr:glycoside hydrolase family 3 protein [Nocardioides sp. SYSU D00065]
MAPRRTTLVLALTGALLALGTVPVEARPDPGDDPRSRFTGPRFQPPTITPYATERPIRTPGWDSSVAVEARVQQILERMTNEEKADLATGQINNNFGFYNNPIERLGIPAQTMADGPVGVRVANPAVDRATTQLPSGTALAATFDEELALGYGRLLGEETFATGHNVQLGPTLDITRTPLWGRAFEGFGEDPLVSGTMGSAVTDGIQEHPVIATLKHPFAYNQETDRFEVDARVDERTLREIYVRPFEQAQEEARPGAMMCSFNRINGTKACESPLMNTIVKEQLGFRGFIMSDYNATPSTVGAANAGLDQEQPGDQGPGSANFGERLLAAVAAGTVSQERLDDMARRILRPMVGLGLFDELPTPGTFDRDRNSDFARRVAARSMVLLKNDDRVLPLRRSARRIAVIGPDADNISAQGGGSSQVSITTAAISPLDGIRARAGAGARVTYSPGTDGISEGDLLPGPHPVPSSVLTPAEGEGDGLWAEYWSNTTFAGDAHLRQVDPNVNVNFGFQNFPGFNAASPKIPTSRGDFALTGDLSARWSGTLTAPADGRYTLGLTARGDATLWVDGEVFVQHTGALSSQSRQIYLEEGEQVDVRVEYAAPAESSYQGGQVRLFWRHPESVLAPAMRAAVDTARAADVAVVVVRNYETEGVDRPDLALPKEQEQLIRQVAAANPRTVVFVETGAPSRVAPWIDRVAGAFQAWYPGQEQGAAIADVLFGDVNPSGHLPVTIPRNERQVPEITPGVARFSEGVFVGYRGFLADRVQPSYPFGFGLSYTEFEYDRLVTDSGRSDGSNASVRVRVTNVGDRRGTDIVQAYAGTLPTDEVETPPRQLAGFERVTLRPGRSRVVTIDLDQRSLSYFDEQLDGWVTPRGQVPIHVGESSADTSLSGTIRVR